MGLVKLGEASSALGLDAALAAAPSVSEKGIGLLKPGLLPNTTPQHAPQLLPCRSCISHDHASPKGVSMGVCVCVCVHAM